MPNILEASNQSHWLMNTQVNVQAMPNILEASNQSHWLMNTQVNVQAMPTILEASNQSHWLIHTQVQYYTLSPNSSYHYEFRYQLLKKDSSHRLILLLGGHKRKCIDWWIFSVGRRILSAIRSSNYSILTVCSARSTFDYNIPIEENQDVKWIYKSLQVWMNDVYYAKYDQYPLLYLYGVSRGSHFAGLLCRVLPVQAQILYIYPGYFEGMTIRSVLDRDLQTRLIVDSTFASWFHFKLCYTMTFDLCLFQSNKISNFSPVPPTYFVHVVNDNKLNESDYTRLIAAIKDDSYELGGLVLNDTESLKLHISFPPNATPSYMQEHFYQWRHKLHASQLLYEHLSGFPKLPEQQNSEYKFQTFWCHRGDFTFFERYPSIMQTWNEKEQEEYREYSNDIKTFHEQLTEEFCGDLRGQHAMLSLDIEDALFWVSEIDSLRQRVKMQNFLSRPLRIWMYNKESLVPERYHNHHIKANCSHNLYGNGMYSSEHIIQVYFNQSSYVDNPLLADYFLIPHDLYCFIFFHQLFANFTDEQFKAHVSHYSNHYFEPIIDRIRYEFPYWIMTDKPGSNHLIAFVGGRNMGVLDNRLQNLLKNVIQLGPTGVRQDLLSPNAPELYLHRNLSIVYRHGYDIVAPPFTPTEIIEINTSNDWYQRKKRLLYFAGILNHSLSSKSVRRLLFAFAKNLSSLIRIGKKEFHPITVVDGHVPMQEYLESIMSSVFFLCPEGYSPWSPRIYEAINLGSIPLILADGIVLPFERFIPWRSFSLKLNVSNVYNILDFVIGNSNSNFEERTKRKKRNAQRYMNAFRWLFKNDRNKQKPDFFIPEEDVKTNVFHYIYRELKCRRIEQFLGASWNIFSSASISARQQTCVKYSHICPCTIEEPIAFDQYNYGNQHSHKQPST
ncbi:unnamed protein product [Rotaria magnacalcarata]|uniref:Exostosin GT47 domain-containing protein n=2 Tax=Rotaria magnacalcarata TaxID=392030 RepID=A0A815SRL4_9BILA|nr:unnamed protein product [Rotaria magnacalcarata]